MKAVLTFLAIIILWLNAIAGYSISMKQKEPAKQKTVVVGNSNIIVADSIPGYAISVSGGSNSVQINNQNPAMKSSATGEQQKDKPNSIEINGEGNSVNIQQSKNGGKVNIQQNGNGNQVTISQNNQITVK